jgi:hypothetical protein
MSNKIIKLSRVHSDLKISAISIITHAFSTIRKANERIGAQLFEIFTLLFMWQFSTLSSKLPTKTDG